VFPPLLHSEIFPVLRDNNWFNCVIKIVSANKQFREFFNLVSSVSPFQASKLENLMNREACSLVASLVLSPFTRHNEMFPVNFIECSR
jgi:hypothetical protein